MNSSELNLSTYTTEDACMWLLSSLNVEEHKHNPYCRPYINYVLTWPEVVPISAIIIMQNPYTKNIFPECAAAMSYNTELCIANMGGSPIPPTVEVLSNDLYIHAGIPKSDTVSVVKDGWMFIQKGILFINESVFCSYDSTGVGPYIESVKQSAVIIRLLQETEKYGKKTVDIYAFGESGERVGSNICSWYKSKQVRLTKHKVTHPAGVARRFSDLSDPKCHMDTPSFSKSLAKYIRNCVAYMHTMSNKKDDKSLKIARLQSSLDNVVRQHRPAAEAAKEAGEALSILGQMTEDPALRNAINSAVEKLNIFSSRVLIVSSTISVLPTSNSDSTISPLVSRPGPSLKYTTPSADLVTGHTGRPSETVSPLPATKVTIKPRRVPLKAPVNDTSSSAVHVSSPQSIISFTDSVAGSVAGSVVSGSTSIVSKKSPIRPKRVAVNNTPTKSTTNSIDAILTSSNTQPTPRVPKYEVPKSSAKPLTDANVQQNYTLTKEHISVLSSVEALVTALTNHQSGSDEEEDQRLYLENIQHDISQRSAYNNITHMLKDAIDKDMQSKKNCNLIELITDNNTEVMESNTYKVCAREFSISA